MQFRTEIEYDGEVYELVGGVYDPDPSIGIIQPRVEGLHIFDQRGNVAEFPYITERMMHDLFLQKYLEQR